MSNSPPNPYRDRQMVYTSREVCFKLSSHVTIHVIHGDMVEITGETRSYTRMGRPPGTEIEARPVSGPLRVLSFWFNKEDLTADWPPKKDKT